MRPVLCQNQNPKPTCEQRVLRSSSPFPPLRLKSGNTQSQLWVQRKALPLALPHQSKLDASWPIKQQHDFCLISSCLDLTPSALPVLHPSSCNNHTTTEAIVLLPIILLAPQYHDLPSQDSSKTQTATHYWLCSWPAASAVCPLLTHLLEPTRLENHRAHRAHREESV